MADNRNPYAPPASRVADQSDLPDPNAIQRLIPNGQAVSFGRGAGWIGDAWRLFRARPGKWLLAFVIFVLIYSAVSWIPFGNLVNGILWPFIGAGAVIAADRQRRTGTFEPEALFAGVRKPVPLLLVGGVLLLTFFVLYGVLASMVGVDVANQVVLNLGGPPNPESVLSRNYGLAMLVYMVVVLPISAATFFAPSLVVLNDLPAGAAMKMSLFGAVKNIVPGLVYGFCSFFFVLVSIIPLGLGLLVSIPVLMITIYTSYRDIFIEETASATPAHA